MGGANKILGDFWSRGPCPPGVVDYLYLSIYFVLVVCIVDRRNG